MYVWIAAEPSFCFLLALVQRGFTPCSRHAANATVLGSKHVGLAALSCRNPRPDTGPLQESQRPPPAGARPQIELLAATPAGCAVSQTLLQQPPWPACVLMNSFRSAVWFWFSLSCQKRSVRGNAALGMLQMCRAVGLQRRQTAATTIAAIAGSQTLAAGAELAHTIGCGKQRGLDAKLSRLKIDRFDCCGAFASWQQPSASGQEQVAS